MSTAPLRAAVEVALEGVCAGEIDVVVDDPLITEMADAAIDAVPDRWGKVDDRWVRLEEHYIKSANRTVYVAVAP